MCDVSEAVSASVLGIHVMSIFFNSSVFSKRFDMSKPKRATLYKYGVQTKIITATPDVGYRESLRNARHQLHIDTADRSKRLQCLDTKFCYEGLEVT
jgi:hypothetical protein